MEEIIVNFKKIKIVKKYLKFSDMPQVLYKFKIPMLIDKQNNVLLGNSNKEQYQENEAINCIVVSSDEFIKETLFFIEKVVAEENEINRLKSIDHELLQYLSNEEEKSEGLSLFEFKEYECITEDNFIKPPEYNFKKAKRTKNKDKGEEDYDDLLSCLRGL